MESATTPATRPSSNGSREDPTEPIHYGAINVLYGSLLAGTVWALRERAREGDPLGDADLARVGLAAFALSKVVAREKIGSWVREPFVEQDAQQRPERPRGRGLRRVVGELLTCTRCVGAWSALGLVGLRVASPPAGRIVTDVLATSAVNDFLQAGFRLVCERTNAASTGR